jgi:hypothetical protein
MSTSVVKEAPGPPEDEAEPAPAPPAKPAMTVDQLVEAYVKLRDKKEAIERAHKNQLAPYRSAMQQIEAVLLTHLNEAHLESMRAHAGTAYKTVRTSARVVRWAETLDFIREKELWELLEARVSKVAVEAVVAEMQAGIPGVEIVREVCVQVRRGS